ncbi:DUF1642 domain-containing protein [Furfurilactobacillus milii]|uniref:DUF1642 domain-containing protein n=1 Tax=Furfurilactobacillus milii TaxID=2888272 RepID=A0ABT6DCG0_9LACO|nr:DUF1642 domain-containing protein [Furfurilactobacillus milii]QLE66951.1 hypothetical protein LROSL2_1601 [Furfurilactobacillus rossiae]MCF6161960.1 DUF1642 domain-containing protein [Furfurilactobacillus milii]MCF6164340.1 DUF1642 domain-containing protein [Furfurilactobacillus milii]MDF9914828.1 DUF1642 domain-containing protein [Furfurilactobacillus milii]QLE69381.1 hypothetical protein LROSL3_1602 [Furfurilactobacillus rossiae]
MSEEKLYVIKSRSDDKFYFSGDRMIQNWSDNLIIHFKNYEIAKEIAEENNGQVVTLIEEPEKVVLTKEQAKIVKCAHSDKLPACYISSKSDDEELLMKAYVNGYSVEKDRKYNVKVPKKWCGDDKYYWAKEKDGTLIWEWLINKDWMKPVIPKNDAQQFTMTEIEYYGLQDCEKEEVTDDDLRD